MYSTPGCSETNDEVATLGPHRFSDLGSIIDHMHALFGEWEPAAIASSNIDVQTLHRVKLAMHEWLANLVQHATFCERQPDILIELQLDGRRVTCVVEDNSDGFDLDGHIKAREGQLDPCPERGMGLLMLNACTDDLMYLPVGRNRNRLSFTITASKDPWLDIPFHL